MPSVMSLDSAIVLTMHFIPLLTLSFIISPDNLDCFTLRGWSSTDTENICHKITFSGYKNVVKYTGQQHSTYCIVLCCQNGTFGAWLG